MDLNKNPTICLALLVCKNEDKKILTYLENTCKYINYWVISNTGLKDSTCVEIIEFFKTRNIKGEFFNDEWKSIEFNKTLLFKRCYKKTDFVLHFGMNMELVGKLDLINVAYNNYISISCKNVKDEIINNEVILFNNNYKWLCSGPKSNNIFCLDNINLLKPYLIYSNEFYLLKHQETEEELANETKLLEILYQSTIIENDYNVNLQHMYNLAMNYFELKDYNSSLIWLTLYSNNKNTQKEELYVVYLKMIECLIVLNYNTKKIVETAARSILLFNDRSESFYLLAIYFMDLYNFDMAYYCFHKIKGNRLHNVVNKFNLNIIQNAYGYNINYNLAITCVKTNRKNEAINLLNELIKDESINNENKIKVSNELNALLEDDLCFGHG
jgi:hypothetical protein